MDYSLEQWMNGPAGSTPWADVLMKIVAGGAEAFFLAFVAAWWVVGWLRHRRPDRVGAVSAVFAAALALGTNQIITRLWSRPRPPAAHPSVHVLLSRSTDPSFPSDHAAAAFAIATAVIMLHRRTGTVIFATAALVAYARVYVGAHYPGDVLAGAVVGIIAGLGVTYPLRRLPEQLAIVADYVMVRFHLAPADQPL